MDSHADTCVVGDNALIVHNFDRPVSVTGYNQKVSHEDASTVTAAVAYDNSLGRTIVLVIHQAIHIPGLQHNLLCPMQMRLNDVRISEIPKFLADEPTNHTHALMIPETEREDELLIPLSLHGVTSYFPTRKPTVAEYENESTLKHELTYESPEWDPHCVDFSNQEDAWTDSVGRIREPGDKTGRGNNFFNSSASQTRPYSFSIDVDSFLSVLQMNVNISSTSSSKNVYDVHSTSRRKSVDAELLARRWDIGLEAAKRTVKSTTQRGVRTVLHPSLSRRFRTNDRQLRYRRLRSDIFGDTLIANSKSRRGNKYAQVFGTSYGWSRVFPMRLKSEAHEGLSLLFKRDGVPPKIIVDGSKEQTQGEFRKKARQADCFIKQTEPYSPFQNAAEGVIGQLKLGAGRKMVKMNSPKVLWDDCLELESFIRSNTAHDIYELGGEVPETIMSGETSDISSFCELGWYQWCKFRDVAAPFPQDKMVLGRYLGPSIDIGPAMTAKILKSNGQVIHTSTYRALTPDELGSDEQVKMRDAFDLLINAKLGAKTSSADLEKMDAETPTYARYEDTDDGKIDEADDNEEEDEITPEVMDNYLGAEVLLPLGDKMVSAKVHNRKRDADGELIGTANQNPILDTRSYEVEFPNGEHAEFSANIIAENMYAQCDPEGNQFLLFDAIVDHKSDGHAVKIADMYVTRNNRRHIRKTTQGWKLCVQWKDGSTSWERLADMKESFPIKVAEYAVAQCIDHEPAFVWWVPFTLKKRNRIIAAVKNRRYQKQQYKYGFKIPNDLRQALEIDKENGNTLWEDSARKEMGDVQIAFNFLDDDNVIPPGYTEVKQSHLIFTIKMEDFRRKSRYVAGGHTVDAPATLTYASVVSRETVRIALTMAALNDLEVKASDIQNAYLTAPCSEKLWLRCGSEFGPNSGKRAIITRALYGLKSAGSSFRNHLAECMRTLGWKSCMADQDLWYKATVRPEDGFEYYSYMLLYVDDALCISHDSMSMLNELDHYFKMKAGSIGDPDIYLGAKLRMTTLPNSVKAWSLSSSKYVQEAVRNTAEYLAKNFDGRKLLKRAPTPFENDYSPEMDVTPELNASQATYFQSQIGVLRWMVELGRIDIMTEVSMLASHSALPREGHLDAVVRVFSYLKHNHNARMVFDPTYPTIDLTSFKECDWKNFYGDTKEAIPPNAPKPLGKEVDLRLFVDSDHAGDKRTRRSRTGYFIFLNMAPVAWLTKKQPTIETSVFGAEFVAMKNGMEALRGLRYKLRMMGVPISGPSYIYGDNMSVIHNTQRPESTLKKKSNSICYHAIRESVAMGECMTGHVSTHLNPADIGTKVLPGGQKRNNLIGMVLYDFADYD